MASVGTLACSKCDENCWEKGWFLAAEGGQEGRKSLCDDCFLICPDISGADRCLRGQVKVIPKKEKKEKKPKEPKENKPRVAKKKAPKAKH